MSTASDIVAAIDAAILSGVSGPGQIRSADGRMITYRSLQELMELRKFYARAAKTGGGSVRLGDVSGC
jgi:hypothetical protein